MDPEYLAHLFHRHATALVLYARQWCDCAEDVVQETFLKLSEQDPQPTPVRPWLFRVARNAAISAQRRSHRRRRREAAQTKQVWFERVDDQLEIDEAVRALKALDETHREAVVARIWGELTFEELATLQACSVATAHRRYVEALRQLQTRLESCEKIFPKT